MSEGAFITASMTVEEWAELDEDVEGEIVDGVLEEEEMPSYLHECVVAWLITTLRIWAVARGGIVGGSEAKFAVRQQRGRKPDLSVYLSGRRPPARAGVIRVPPDIMVEVVSPRPRDGRRDRVEKPPDYAAFGVRFYWIVDPELRTLEVLELVNGRYTQALGVSSGRVSDIPACPGLEVDLDALWSEVDALLAAGDDGPASDRGDRG